MTRDEGCTQGEQHSLHFSLLRPKQSLAGIKSQCKMGFILILHDRATQCSVNLWSGGKVTHSFSSLPVDLILNSVLYFDLAVVTNLLYSEPSWWHCSLMLRVVTPLEDNLHLNMTEWDTKQFHVNMTSCQMVYCDRVHTQRWKNGPLSGCATWSLCWFSIDCALTLHWVCMGLWGVKCLAFTVRGSCSLLHPSMWSFKGVLAQQIEVVSHGALYSM